MTSVTGAGSGQVAGKVVAITGAGRGIGAATARLLAARGARVVLGSRGKEELAAWLGKRTFTSRSASNVRPSGSVSRTMTRREGVVGHTFQGKRM